MLETGFNKILEEKGKEISKDTYVIEEYPQGGMSGGSVSLTWWREIGLPLLKSRYLDLIK